MIYPSKHDFSTKFKLLINDDIHFIDCILVNTSDNFQRIMNIAKTFVQIIREEQVI